MKEASVLGPFLSALRKELPGAVVFKHRDASMVGMPDASMTWNGRTLWIEGKLYNLPRAGDPGWTHWMKKAQEESPTQAETMRRLAKTAASVYVIWVKKTCIYIGYPDAEASCCVRRPSDAVERLKIMWANWKDDPAALRPYMFTSKFSTEGWRDPAP